MKYFRIYLSVAIMTLLLICCTGPTFKEQSADSMTPSHVLEDSTEIGIQETVLADEKGLKVTATVLESDQVFGIESQDLNLLCENNSNQDVRFRFDHITVNRFSNIYPSLSVDITAGNKANYELQFLDDFLDLCQINNISSIEFDLSVVSTENNNLIQKFPRVHIDTMAPIKDEKELPGVLVYNQDNIRIYSQGIKESPTGFGRSAIFLIENNGEENMVISFSDIAVNGFMGNYMYYRFATALPGKCALLDVIFDVPGVESDISDIENIETVSLRFTFRPEEDLIGSEVESDVITVSMETND